MEAQRPRNNRKWETCVFKYAPQIESINLTLDGNVLSLNQLLRLHWSKRKKYNDNWYDQVYYKLGTQRPVFPYGKVCLVITRLGSRFMDFDGLAGSMKPIVDGLVRAGVMIDDSWDVTGPWILNQEKCKRGHEKIFITVTPSVSQMAP